MIVADTSALVSLAAAETLNIVVEEFNVATTRTVLSEVQETAAYDDRSGVAAQTVLTFRERLQVHGVDPPEIESNRIDEGEASCIALARELDADFLVTDDVRALPELQPLTDARVAISPLVLKALVKRNRLTPADARDRLDEMAERRSWLGAPIYRKARELFRH